MHKIFLLHVEILKTAIYPRELAPSPYFLLCRYTLFISMYLQKLMNIHYCFFKISGKNQSVADGHTGGETDNVKTVYPTTHKVCGGIITRALRLVINRLYVDTVNPFYSETRKMTKYGMTIIKLARLPRSRF